MKQKVIGVLVGAGLLAAALVGPAGATPHETGCPTGWDVLDVATLTAEGYRLPARVDGEGNRNGVICGLELPERACEAQNGGACEVERFYNFRDDDSPARR